MQASGETVHIPDDNADEIGLIARTLNGLLAQVHSFNDELRREVAVATQDLNKRNIALEETTRQMVQMQQQLLQAQRLATVGQMAATFAHEIGSPMSALSVQVQLLLEDSGLTDEQRETLGIIRHQIQAVVQIVNDLLHTARRGPSDFVLTDLNETLGTVMKLVQPKLLSQHISFKCRSPAPASGARLSAVSSGGISECHQQCLGCDARWWANRSEVLV